MLVIAIVCAYLIGSISTSTILTRLIAKTDIRKHGSGNAGATNTMRVLGTKWGIVVLVIDALKGIVAVRLGAAWDPSSTTALALTGVAVVAGHNWPVFFRFRGGKGIATTIGVFLTIHATLEPALIAGAVAIVLLAITRYVSLASLCFTVLTPVISGALHRPVSIVLFASVVAVFSLYRHQQNIQRLMHGTEHRIFTRT